MLDISVPIGAIVREGSAGDIRDATRKASGVVVSPSGEQTTLGEGGSPSIELAEQGFYSVRLQGTGDRRPFQVAVNLDPAESDLSALSPAEFLGTATGRARRDADRRRSLEKPELTPADIEKKQSFWWFLLVGGCRGAPRRRPCWPTGCRGGLGRVVADEDVVVPGFRGSGGSGGFSTSCRTHGTSAPRDLGTTR